MQKPSSKYWRYYLLIAVFSLVCLVYAVRLLNLQVTGRDRYVEAVGSDTVRHFATVQAVRGEIYDCNGKKLVGNEYKYHFALDYTALPADADEENRALLSALSVMDTFGVSFSPTPVFAGTYPDLTVVNETRFSKFLSNAGLDADATVADAVKYLNKKYNLDGDYTDAERAKLLSLRTELVASGFGTKDLQYVLCKDVSAEFIAYVSEQAVGGLCFASEVSRVYLYPGYASHILGRISKIYTEDWAYYRDKGYSMNDMVGVSGCELAFEDDLRGVDGEVEIISSTDGTVLETRVKTQAVAGKDVYLTIDIDLQIAAEDGLAENVAYIRSLGTKYEGCNAGAVVALDPDTGGVLCIGSYPTYDLSYFNEQYAALSADTAKPLLNRALNEIYAPGSTFKLGVAAAAMTEGILTADTTHYCSGVYTYYADYKPKCWYYPNSHGTTNTVKAIRVSCNCFFYETGRLLGIDKIVEYASALGLGAKTGIELGEAQGVLASPAEYPLYHKDENGNPLSWTPGQTIQAAIGQSDNAFTPVQLCNYVAALTSGGTRYTVHLLKEVRAFDGTLVRAYTPTVTATANLSGEAVATVIEGMREVVWGNATATRGNEISTGNSTVQKWTKNLPVTVGAKTGTAQASSTTDNALLVMTAPYDDPEIVLCCVMEKGASGQYAALTPARILEKYYQIK